VACFNKTPVGLRQWVTKPFRLSRVVHGERTLAAMAQLPGIRLIEDPALIQAELDLATLLCLTFAYLLTFRNHSLTPPLRISECHRGS
jgi:hypothetical protein